MMPNSVMKQLKASKQRRIGAILLLAGFVIGFGIGTAVSQQSTQGTILFTIAYSSEKASWMEQIKPLFLEWYASTYGNSPSIKIDFFPVGSVESINALVSGQYKPAIWSPAAALWIPYLNLIWEQQYGTGTPPITTINVSTMYSPIIIATWQSLKDRYNITSLEDLHALAAMPGSPLKLAHTDPRQSNSGFCATIMAVAAAAKKNSFNLVYQDLTNATIRTWMKEFESAAVYYGTSTGYLVQSMLQSGPSGINIAFLYENLVTDKSKSAKAQWNDPLVAIYPTEGCIHSDHPFCVLDGAPWMIDQPFMLDLSTRFVNEFLHRRDVLELATQKGFRVYDPTIILPNATFNANKGVRYDISSVPKLSVPKDPNFIARVADFWLMNRPVT
jgi:hypothetical protein